VRSALAFTLVSWALVACGEDQGVDPTPHPEVTAADAGVRLVEKEQAHLMLYVSNQSFDDEKVRLTVAVDGVTVVDGDFHVAGQHNWVSFPLGLSPGVHEVTGESDTGATLASHFGCPATRRATRSSITGARTARPSSHGCSSGNQSVSASRLERAAVGLIRSSA
jgi:hypothetical protein